MDADTLGLELQGLELQGLELQQQLQSRDMDWIRQLPDAQVLDPRHWPTLLMRQHPYPPLHSVIWYAALARESMRRLNHSGTYPGYADDRGPGGHAVCLKTALHLLQSA